jgi:hypothetical protein
MTTIAQLPTVGTVGSSDLLALSQAGLLYSASVSQLTANLQTVISVPMGDLLGRQSTGAGAPEAISVGTGLVLGGGSLSADGADHAGFPVQAALALSDDIVISAEGAPALLPMAALRGLFSAGNGVAIDGNGVITVTVSSLAGPAGPQGAAGPAGPSGAVGAPGPAGAGLTGPQAGNSASSIGASDYVALWQNGGLAWMTYGQFLGGQTINQLPAAGPAADSDELLVAQGGNTLSTQSFGAIWTYVQGKLPSVQQGVVELTSNTVLDATEHNDRILVASSALTLTANFNNTGPGFFCTLINLAPGPITMGTGISSGSGSTTLPPGAATTLLGFSYSGGSLVWWSGVVPNAPTLTVASISAPAANTAFSVSGGVFNDAPTALDYSVDGGVTWVAATGLVITTNAYSFSAAGLAPGTYATRVRDHGNVAVIGVSNSFTVVAPSLSIAALPLTAPLGKPIAVSGAVSPASNAVQVGLSGSATGAPTVWVSAGVAAGVWMASLTPSAAGTVYVWAQQVAAPAVTAVSGAITVVAASLTIAAPAAGVAGTALTVSGSVAPVGDAVNVQLASQNTAVPTTGWSAATNSGGVYSAALTPAAAGTYYAWAQDPATGLSNVSAAIAVTAGAALSYGVNNPGGSYVHGVSTIPLNGAITPAQNVPTQVALSTSGTVVPSAGWEAASVIYGNALWAVYYPTPAVAGTYYVWVENTAGGSPTVSSFTIAVS